MSEPTSVYEYAGNPHVHTEYSDGTALHGEIAQIASEAGIDFVIVTDHNVWVDGCEGYYDDVLLLVGEELHDVRRTPQANHLLVFGADSELVTAGSDAQGWIDAAHAQGGLAVLAHPVEYGSRVRSGLRPIPWVDWEVEGATGIEIWNYMSEVKSLMRTRFSALFSAFFPSVGIRGPFRAALRKWDELLAAGERVVAIGGADAHGTVYSMGPISRAIFPYDHCFKAVNTHVLTKKPLNGILEHDKALIYEALQAGRTWVGYDRLAPTEGFRFMARSGQNRAWVGSELVRTGAAIFEVQVPQAGDIRLVREGKVVAQSGGDYLKFTTVETGAYRVEVHRRYRLRKRGWIFSSPIYVI